MELSPVEVMHTSTVPINLDVDQRLNLLHELRNLASELQENPFIEPAKSVTELKGVRLRPASKNGPVPQMGIKISSSDSEPSSASISLTGDRQEGHEQRTYIHRPSLNVWEEWRPGMSEALTIMSNSGLVTTLESKLPEGALESILDGPSNGLEVAQLLASYLAKKARTHTQNLHYKAHGIQVGTPEFTRDTDFVVDTNNKRVAHNLFVAASFNLDDYGHLRKIYRYETVDEHGYLKSTYGTVSISAGTSVPKTRLNAFGLRDPIRNDPSYGIEIGVNDIRQAYNPTETI